MTIHFDRVRKEYGSQVALDGLSLTLPSQQLTVLVGPSGSGKSTLLRTINHLVEPTAGSVSLDGRRVDTWKPEVLRRSIGYVIQNVGLFPHFTVGRNVAAVPRLLKWSQAKTAARVEELLTLVGLEPGQYRDRYPHELSGGEAQRVGVARALAADPPVLLLDEPFSAVDPVTRLRLQAEFLAIQKTLHKTVVFVTHDVDEAIRLADSIVLLDHGRVVQQDTPEVLLDKPATPFVAHFLGSDRALKRLSRLTVGASLTAASHSWTNEALAELGVRRDASLREALSLMVGSGARTLPVLDEQGRLVGEIRLETIEAVGQGAPHFEGGAL